MSSANLNITNEMEHKCSLCKKAELNISAFDTTRYFCDGCYKKYKIEHILSVLGLTDKLNDNLEAIKQEYKDKKKAERLLKIQELLNEDNDEEDNDGKIGAIKRIIETNKKIAPKDASPEEKRKIYEANRRFRPDKKAKVKCLCGESIGRGSMSVHIKTHKHKLLVEANKDISEEDRNEPEWTKWSTVINSSNTNSNTSSNSSSNNATGYNSDDEKSTE